MGLAICHKIVEQHDGTIVAQSTPEQGSTFTITLPTRKNTPQRSLAMHLTTLLLADDDPDECQLTREALEEEGYISTFALHCVSDGEELLDYLHQRGKYHNSESSPPPSLILLDLDMPRKDGREALKAIKSDPKLRRIPVIVMSSSHSEEKIWRTYDLGVNSFIVKPMNFKHMTQILHSTNTYWFETAELPT